MKQLNVPARVLFVCLVALATLVGGCGSSRATSDADTRTLQERYTNLAQVVRNLPNVQVTGDLVVYRGPSSLTSSNEMQFLVKDVLIGSMAQAEALYPLYGVSAVRVVPPNEAISRYGTRGSAGLIELILID